MFSFSSLGLWPDCLHTKTFSALPGSCCRLSEEEGGKCDWWREASGWSQHVTWRQRRLQTDKKHTGMSMSFTQTVHHGEQRHENTVCSWYLTQDYLILIFSHLNTGTVLIHIYICRLKQRQHHHLNHTSTEASEDRTVSSLTFTPDLVQMSQDVVELLPPKM